MRNFSLHLRTVWREDAQRAGERGSPAAWALCSKALLDHRCSVKPTMSSQGWTINGYFFLNVIWVLWFHWGLFPTLSLCKDVYGSLHDLSDRDDLQGAHGRERLPYGWWDKSVLAKCPAWRLPIGSWRGCSGPLPQKRGRICTWDAPWGLGGAGELFTSSPEINGCSDVSSVSPAGTLGCHWFAKVEQQGNITLERDEELQGQCSWCELRRWARWYGRQYPSPSLPSSLATSV